MLQQLYVSDKYLSKRIFYFLEFCKAMSICLLEGSLWNYIKTKKQKSKRSLLKLNRQVFLRKQKKNLKMSFIFGWREQVRSVWVSEKLWKGWFGFYRTTVKQSVNLLHVKSLNRQKLVLAEKHQPPNYYPTDCLYLVWFFESNYYFIVTCWICLCLFVAYFINGNHTIYSAEYFHMK